jgi:glucose/arabinose dehydrogenase
MDAFGYIGRWAYGPAAALLCASLAPAATAAPVCAEPDARAPLPSIVLHEIAAGLRHPVHLTHAPGQHGTLYIVEQAGRIRLFDKDGGLRAEPFLDIADAVSSGGERGLLSVAFHPDYASNGYFYVNYTASVRGRLLTRVSRFERLRAHGSGDRNGDERGDGARAAPDSERVLLEIEQPYSNHNGGQLAFGPDGMLYIGMGDGGAADDPHGHGQNLATLLGALLRIDVDGGGDERAYGIPTDNPFVTVSGARPEIWAYGLRNPWRFSFDRASGRLYLADVGQNRREEINVIERGGNYGWSLMEAELCHAGSAAQCARADLLRPLLSYGRGEGVSVTGGHVYRGTAIDGLCGAYLYGDFGSGRIWALRHEGGKVTVQRELLKTSLGISSFGEDADGELYVLDHRAGAVMRIGASAGTLPASLESSE